MNKIDKWLLLNLVIPAICSGVTAYYITKYYDRIMLALNKIFN